MIKQVFLVTAILSQLGCSQEYPKPTAEQLKNADWQLDRCRLRYQGQDVWFGDHIDSLRKVLGPESRIDSLVPKDTNAERTYNIYWDHIGISALFTNQDSGFWWLAFQYRPYKWQDNVIAAKSTFNLRGIYLSPENLESVYKQWYHIKRLRAERDFFINDTVGFQTSMSFRDPLYFASTNPSMVDQLQDWSISFNNPLSTQVGSKTRFLVNHRQVVEAMGEKCNEPHWFDTLPPVQPWQKLKKDTSYRASPAELAKAPWQLDSCALRYNGKVVWFGESIDSLRKVLGPETRIGYNDSYLWDRLSLIVLTEGEFDLIKQMNFTYLHALADNSPTASVPRVRFPLPMNLQGSLVTQYNVRNYGLMEYRPDHFGRAKGFGNESSKIQFYSTQWLDEMNNPREVTFSTVANYRAMVAERCPEVLNP